VLRTRGGQLEIGAVTDPIVEKFYTAQIIAEDGPMWQSLETSSTVYIPAVDADSRWPDWQALVTDAGIRSVLHVPMKAGGTAIGVLSLYTRQPQAFSSDDEAIAHILAQHASVAVATTRQEAALSSAIDARKMVGQAMGMLMERFDLDGDQAFAVLRRYSQDNNVKLHDAAHHFVDSRSSHSSEGRRGVRP
jgi:GAF domain-containing protein